MDDTRKKCQQQRGTDKVELRRSPRPIGKRSTFERAAAEVKRTVEGQL